MKSASAEYGVTSKTLKKRLRAIGAQGPISAGPSDAVVLFEATGLENELRKIEDAISKTVAVAYLGLKPVVGETIFSSGLIPHVHLPGAKASRAKAYLKGDLDAFVASLLVNATVWDGDDCMCAVPRAVGRARTPLNQIVQLIIDGQDAFDDEYVSLLDLSAEMTVYPLSVNKRMKQKGVAPAFKRPTIPATYYRRREIEPHLPK